MIELVHLYFGDGKGKTSAAVGLAIRAAGCGRKVAFVQFMKGSETGEVKILSNIPNIKVLRSGKDFGFFKDMTENDKKSMLNIHNALLEEGISFVGNEGVLILDEITHALNFCLINEDRLREIIAHTNKNTEVVMTGRSPESFLIESADYVSEIKKIKHPFDKGVKARKGVEF